MSDSSVKRKASIINLSLFANLSETFSSCSDHASSKSNKTQRKFGGDGGVVGLGIVAAMNKNNDDENNNNNKTTTHDADFAATNMISKSQPIPIVSVKPFAKLREPTLEIDEMELSESYTCVISRLGNNNNNNSVKKREYFGSGGGGGGDDTANGDLQQQQQQQQQQGLVFFTSPPKYLELESVFQASDDFLSTCCLCKKKLYGLDIFMYRGYKAFCSEDCRSKQIRIDDRKRKRQSDSVKKPFDYSVSPCSAPRFFTASVAAA